jgi:hypothetical protein
VGASLLGARHVWLFIGAWVISFPVRRALIPAIVHTLPPKLRLADDDWRFSLHRSDKD